MASTVPDLQDKAQVLDKSPGVISSAAEVGTSPESTNSSAPEVCTDAASSPASAPSPIISSAEALALRDALQTELGPLGFECYPLLIGWYNAQVAAGFHLPHPANTLAILVISTPDMFECCFVPHVRRVGQDPSSRRDPLDSCMRHVIGEAARRVHESARVLHDFDLGPTRRPRVLVQTAGHVSGAVHLYRREGLKEDPWPDKRSMMGVCLHPVFGGWFSLRAVVVLEGVEVPDLPRHQPPEILIKEEQKRELLELFNFHWRDWRYRDVAAKRQYSALQTEYFKTPPGERQPIVERIIRGEVPKEEHGGKQKEDGKTSGDGEE